MAYILAVDAGGTKTEFLLAEQGRELARARTGTIKRVNTEAETAQHNLEEALAELERQTGISASRIDRTCIGTSGDTVPLVTDWLHKSFSAHVGGSLLIVGDVEIALDAAFEGKPGVLVLAGTGSNVAARSRNGEIATAGGWGPMLADQGAGHWIGMEGLRRGFLARDEQRPTDLLERARRLWNLPSVDALIEFANAQPPQRYGAQFAREVVAAADAGDPVAVQILEQGGEELAYLASQLIDRMLREDPVLPPVALAGSILAKVKRERASLQNALQRRYAQIRFIEKEVDPVCGALWRALQPA